MRRLAPTLAFALLVTCCGVRADELPTAAPRDVGLSVEKLAELSAALEQLVEDGRLPGVVVLVARRGKVAYCEAFGFRDLASQRPMTEDTIFAIASMTKPITCVAA